MKNIGPVLGSPFGAGLLATIFGLMAMGVVAALALALELPPEAGRVLEGLAPATGLACLLIAARLALPLPLRYQNLLAAGAVCLAFMAHLPLGEPAPDFPLLGTAAPMVSAGILFASLSLLAGRPRETMPLAMAVLGSLPLAVLTLIGLLGCASWVAGPATDTSWLPWLAVSPAPAVAFLGLAAWSARHRAMTWLPAMRNDDRIALLTFVVLTLLVTITGFATFWAVQTRLQDSEQERLVQSAYRREMAFNYQLDSAERVATTLAQRPSVARALLSWAHRPEAAGAVLREEMDSAWNERMTAIRFQLPDTTVELPSRGAMLASVMPPVRIDSADDKRFEVQWRDGLLARVRVPVMQGDTLVGWVESQQRLQLLTAQLFETSDLGPGVEVRLCYPVASSGAACMPAGPGAGSTIVPMRQVDGRPSAIALAVRGDQGAMLTTDLDGAGVIDVYASVRRPLGLRLRQSVDAVMAPVREKLKQVLSMVAVLLGAGMAVLILQVRPLASRLVASERNAREAQARARAHEVHLRTVMDNVADGIVTTDTGGGVTYLNRAAVSMTGWGPAEAIGQPVSAIYQVVDPATGSPVPDLVSAALAGGAGRGDAEVDLVPRGRDTRLAVADRVSVVRQPDGSLAGTVLVFHDVTAQRERTEAIRHEATHDALTGLANRKVLERRLTSLAGEDPSVPASLHSLLYIDLDKFKHVNDTAGHEAGDHLLQQVTALMHKGLRASDLLARVGGDEFAALLLSCGPQDAAGIAEALRAAVQSFEFHWRGATFKVGTSIGIATFEGGAGDMAEIVRSADAACYRAKRAGRDNVQVHEAVLRRRTA